MTSRGLLVTPQPTEKRGSFIHCNLGLVVVVVGIVGIVVVVVVVGLIVTGGTAGLAVALDMVAASVEIGQTGRMAETTNLVGHGAHQLGPVDQQFLETVQLSQCGGDGSR